VIEELGLDPEIVTSAARSLGIHWLLRGAHPTTLLYG
jgi:hypothetical protein